jgi:hypothetical protein
LESEAAHSMNAQNRSGGYAAEYCDWRQTAPKVDPKDFHAHLDQCAQCRNHPMALCSVGANLLKGAVVLSQPHGVIEQPMVIGGVPREIRCMLCNDCGMARPCPGCQKVDPYLKAYQGSLVNDETGDPNS